MWRFTAAALVFFVLAGLIGCGRSSDSAGPRQGAASSAASDAEPADNTPQGAVAIFLGAVCAGNDEHAANMLTDLARRKTAEMDLEVAPPGSDTARFQVDEVEILGDDAARVTCSWSDLDEEGARSEEQIVWVLRRESVGWRIAGMAPTIFPGEPPLVLNFEDPEEMLQKLEWVQQEAMRRAQAEAAAGTEGVRFEAQRQDGLDHELRR